MKQAVVYLEDDRTTALFETVNTLTAGGVVVFPTDTVYGLMTAVDSRHGYQRIFKLKGRLKGKPLALLIETHSSAAQAASWLLADHARVRQEFEAGTTTLICQPNLLPPATLPPAATNLQPGSVGLRLPRHQDLQQVLARIGGFIWATSANAAADPAPATAEAMLAAIAGFDGTPDLVVLSHEKLPGIPSRLVQLLGNRLVDLVR